MKVSVKQILEGQQVVGKMLDSKLPAATAFKFGRLVSKVDNELKLFDTQRLKLIEQYGEKVDENQYKIKEEHSEVFNHEMSALLAVEIDLDANQISISELGEIEITPRELLKLDWLIVA